MQPCNRRFPPYGLAVDIDLSGRADPGEEWGAHLVRYPPSTAITQLWGFYIPRLTIRLGELGLCYIQYASRRDSYVLAPLFTR